MRNISETNYHRINIHTEEREKKQTTTHTHSQQQQNTTYNKKINNITSNAYNIDLYEKETGLLREAGGEIEKKEANTASHNIRHRIVNTTLFCVVFDGFEFVIWANHKQHKLKVSYAVEKSVPCAL